MTVKTLEYIFRKQQILKIVFVFYKFHFKTNVKRNILKGTFSSVAGGGGRDSPPIGLKSMQNSTFFVVLRPIFAPKVETALPTGLGSRRWLGRVIEAR